MDTKRYFPRNCEQWKNQYNGYPQFPPLEISIIGIQYIFIFRFYVTWIMIWVEKLLYFLVDF